MIRIAIINDQPLFRQGFGILAKQLHYDVSIDAPNGAEFIAQIAQNPSPDIILMDTQLKGMDSYTLLQWIKNNHPQVPVIVQHGKNDFHYVIQLLRAGASMHLSKTAKPSEVQRTLYEVIQNSKRKIT
ncbi:MAG TPA: response regulator transcription factor [Flavitalea sp.]|nr:response regulator transcription factor [Flavitalea sp.]